MNKSQKMGFWSLWLSFFSAGLVQAEIVTDGSVGLRQTLAGPQMQIPAALGQQLGSTLFHSFADFQVQTGEAAVFQGPASIGRILARVTGGTPSAINGLLASEVGQADLFLINPAGIWFGPEARLAVPAAFFASTADYVGLADGGRFAARQPNDSQLTMAEPVAFGFLGASPASVNVDQSQLQVAAGQRLSLSAGAVHLTGTEFDRDRQGAPLDNPRTVRLSAPDGQIDVSTLHSGELALQDGSRSATARVGGEITTRQAVLTVAGAGGGKLSLHGGPVSLQQSHLDNSSHGAEAGGRIDIRSTRLEITDNSALDVRNSGTGQGSAVSLQADSQLRLVGSPAQLSTLNAESLNQTAAGGDGGAVSLSADTVELRQGARINSSTFGGGDGGQVTIQANTVTLAEVSGETKRNTSITFDANSNQAEAGRGSAVEISAKAVHLQDGAELQTGTRGGGDAGSLTITASEVFEISGVSTNGTGGRVTNRVLGESSGGRGGAVRIKAGQVIIDDGARISAITNGPGDASSVFIEVTGALTMQGTDESGAVSGILSTSDGGKEAETVGQGGLIEIRAGSLTLRDGAQIDSSAVAKSEKRGGEGGAIHLVIQGTALFSGVNPHGEYEQGFSSGVYAASVGANGSVGQAGNIVIEAQRVIIEQGAVLRSSTNNQAPGGHISVSANESIEIRGDTSQTTYLPPARQQISFIANAAPAHYNQATSGVYSDSENVGPGGAGGNVTLRAPQIALSQNATISSTTQGGGTAGQIRLDTDNLQVNSGATIVSASQQQHHYHFANTAARDAATLSTGDIVEITDVDAGKRGWYLNAGDYVFRLQPALEVPTLAALYQLANESLLNEGDVVRVRDTGAGSAAYYLLSYENSIQAGAWVKVADTVTAELADLHQAARLNSYYAPDALPYPSGTLIQVARAWDNKPALFVFTADIRMPDTGKLQGRAQHMKAYEAQDLAGLQRLAAETWLLDGDVARLETGEQYAFYAGRWISLQQIRRFPDIASLRQTTLVQPGMIASTADGQHYINSLHGWYPLGQNQVVSDLAARDALPAQAGDLVTLTQAPPGTATRFFYDPQAGWQPQFRSGDAGVVNIATGSLHLNQGTITTESVSSGGGQIQINAAKNIVLHQGAISSSVQQDSGNGGNLQLHSEVLALKASQITARAFEGAGGSIQLHSHHLLQSPDSLIDASSKLGMDGQVIVTSPAQDVSNRLFIVQEKFLSTDELAPADCVSPEQRQHFSRFNTQTQPAGIARTPDDFQE